MKNLFTSITLILGLVLFANSKIDAAVSYSVPKEISLDSSRWKLVSIHSENGIMKLSGVNAFIKFNKESGRVSGKGGCNNFGGSFKSNGDSLTMDHIFSTKMYCEQIQKTEDLFFNLLQSVNHFEIKDSLLLLYKSDELLLEFSQD